MPFDGNNLPFPGSLPEFQQLFPDDSACAAYLEAIRWPNGFVCPCGEAGEPYRIKSRPHVLVCRKCRKETRIMAGTVMQDSHTRLSIWFWGAYLVATQTPGMSAIQFQRQLGLKRYERAFQILHKLRAATIRPDRDRIGGDPHNHVELDEVWIGGESHGKGRGVHDKTLVIGAVEVRRRKPKEGSKAIIRRNGRYAGRVRLQTVPDRSAKSLVGFVQSAVKPGTQIVSDAWGGFNALPEKGYRHVPVTMAGNPAMAEDYLPIIHLVFSNLKTWLRGIHHGVSPQHLQAYCNEYAFRFNRRFYPFNAFRSLLGISGQSAAPTYASLYSGEWEHPRCSDRLTEGISV
jgi:hypothetical protein